MPADLDDGAGSDVSGRSGFCEGDKGGHESGAFENGHCGGPEPPEACSGGGGGDGGFNAAAWAPEERRYGILNLLICRGAVAEEEGPPSEIASLKAVDTRLCSFPAAPPGRRRGPGAAASDEEGYVSEGEHGEPTGSASWSGRSGSWWRVHNQLGEDLLVREGVSLRSAQLRRVAPGELVQQAGPARSLMAGAAKGCIRLPVRPAGWVSADATRAGGPKYLVRASVPRWRVVYCPEGGKGGGSVIVREGEALGSDEVTVLHRGDVVEQAGPAVSLPDGIVRMPITATVVRRSDMENGEPGADYGANGHASRATASGRTLGWVTADASAAGGPVFFKPVSEADRGDKQQQQHQQHQQQQQQQQQQRRRRPKAAA